MPNTPKNQWPYPSERENPFYDKFEALVTSQDTSVNGLQEDRNNILSGGGTISWDAGTNTLTWTDVIYVMNPTVGFYSSLAAGSVSLNTSGKFLYVSLTRSQTDNIALSASTATQLTSLNDQYVIAIRVANTVILRNGITISDGQSITLSPVPPTTILDTVSADYTAANTSNLILSVQGCADDAVITLPAVLTGMRVTVSAKTDAANYYIGIVCDGTDKFQLVTGGETSEIQLIGYGAVVTFIGAEGVGWIIEEGTGYGVSPKSLGSPYLWLDTRRGMLPDSNSKKVTTWNDLSSNAVQLTQATSGNRPVLLEVAPGLNSLAFVNSLYMSASNMSWNAANATIIAGVFGNWQDSPSTVNGVFGLDVASNKGLGLYWNQATAQDWQDYDWVAIGNGYNSAQNPRSVSYLPAVGKAANYVPQILTAQLGSTSKTYLGQEVMDSRASSTASITAITNKTFELGRIGTDYLNGGIFFFLIIPSILSSTDIQTFVGDLQRQIRGK